MTTELTVRPARVVLLGASNLTAGLPIALATALRLTGPGPHAVLVAAGHGRSYGRWSRVAFRALPGILDCGLWTAARAGNGAPTYALVTDIGNDLAYGASAAALAGWIAACLERLAALDARVVLTLLPARSIARLAPWQYHLFKAALFPGRRLPFAVLRGRIAEANERLAAVAGERGVAVIDPEPDWYGPDAIHVKRGRQAAVWRHVLSRWGPEWSVDASRPAAERGRPLGRLRPEWRTVLGVPLRRRQPSRVLADGTTLSLY